MDNAYSSLLKRLRETWTTLPDKQQESPESTLDTLFAVAEREGRPVEDLVQERMKGVPLAYLTGTERFLGIELETNPGAMIPRKETECLARTALKLLKTLEAEDSRVTLLDLCTGSGNLALALSFHENNCATWAGDVSAEAVQLARRNCARLGLTERVTFLVGDFLEPFKQLSCYGSADLLVCNPPYISSQKVDGMATEIIGFEPRAAFDGGPLGISFLMRLARQGHEAIRPGGWIACEVGVGQGPALCRIFEKTGKYNHVEGIEDDQQTIRVVIARKA